MPGGPTKQRASSAFARVDAVASAAAPSTDDLPVSLVPAPGIEPGAAGGVGEGAADAPLALLGAPPAEPGGHPGALPAIELAGTQEVRARTNDAIPRKVMELIVRYRRRTGADTALVVVTAVTKAHADGVLPRLASAYTARGAVTTLFGTHRPQKQHRASSPVRLNYNPTQAELRGYSELAGTLGISRAVLISLALAYYFEIPDPAALT
jgi:hypothetical protein